MKVKELIKNLKQFDQDSEVDMLSCWSETCPCAQEGGGKCDSKNCEWTIYDISHIKNLTKDADADEKDHDRVSIYIEAYDGWSYDSEGELIKEN